MSLLDLSTRLKLYLQLTRLDKPIGILLLLWPTLIGVWVASYQALGYVDIGIVAIFSIGTVLMRSAGCVVNDYADRDFDKHVKRTAQRPITSGKIKSKEALLLALALVICALLLILPLNALSKQLSIIALALAASYPFFKRFFALPQAYLGIAFGFGIPMAFAALQNAIPLEAWLMLLANVGWTIAYDTEYAMVDRDDDIKIGIKTSALTFGTYDVSMVMLCYVSSLGLWSYCGWRLHLAWPFYMGIITALGISVYHYSLIKNRNRDACFYAFKHNNWWGASLFVGVVASYLV